MLKVSLEIYRLKKYKPKTFNTKNTSETILRAQVPGTAARVSCVILLAGNFSSFYFHLFHISEKFGPAETIADRNEIRNIDVLSISKYFQVQVPIIKTIILIRSI